MKVKKKFSTKINNLRIILERAQLRLGPFFILFLVMSTPSFSKVPHSFSLDLEYKGKNTIQHERVHGFINNISAEYAPEVKFSINKAVKVSFVDFPNELTRFCDQRDFDHYVKSVDGKEIQINNKMIELIITYGYFHQENECSYKKAFMNVLKSQLISLKKVVDIREGLSTKEKVLKKICRENIKVRSSKCNKVFKKSITIRKMKRYKKRINKIGNFGVRLSFDTTSLTHIDLRKYDICKQDYTPTKILKSGKKVKMLGLGIVYMSPGFSTSQAGHVAERYVYCLGNELKDFMFEYTQIRTKELPVIKEDFPTLFKKENENYLNSIDGKVYLKYIRNPASNRMFGYGHYQYHNNRSVLEVWPEASELEMFQGLQENLSYRRTQKENIRAQKALPEYDLLKNNCTHSVRNRLRTLSNGKFNIPDIMAFNPISFFEYLKKIDSTHIILYPSQRLMRKMQLLEEGKSLFWEHFTFWSRASKKGEPLGTMVFYPERGNALKNFLINPTMGAINVSAAIGQTLIGVIQSPMAFFKKVPGIKEYSKKVSKKSKRNFKVGLNSIKLSLPELFGIRLRYPSPTDWTREELKYINEISSHKDPILVDHFYSKVFE